MKAQHIRPIVQNGPIARRGPSRKAPNIKATKSAEQSKRFAGTSRAEAEGREPDSRVFWMMVLVGAVLTTGFVLGLRSQISAHQLNRAEEKLKDELDRYVGQQKFLSLQQQRARSPRESERAVKEAGLVQLKLDQQNALPREPARPAATAQSKAAPVLARVSTARSAAAPAMKDRQAVSVKTRKESAAKTVAGKPAASKQLNLSEKKPGEKKLAVKKPAGKTQAVKAVAPALKPKNESSRPRQVASVTPRR